MHYNRSVECFFDRDKVLKVLVIGSSSIALYVAKELTDEGHEVTMVDENW